MPIIFIYSISLRVIMFEASRLRGLAGSVLGGPPYSVREWCRFLIKLSRLPGKTDCFQPVSFGTPCNPQFRCRGVSIINFACVMTDSRPLKNSQTAAEELQSSTPGTPESLRACWGRLRGTSRYPLFRSRVVSIFD